MSVQAGSSAGDVGDSVWRGHESQTNNIPLNVFQRNLFIVLQRLAINHWCQRQSYRSSRAIEGTLMRHGDSDCFSPSSSPYKQRDKWIATLCSF